MYVGAYRVINGCCNWCEQGAARRANFKKQNPDVESVGANEEPDKEPSPRMRFRLEVSLLRISL